MQDIVDLASPPITFLLLFAVGLDLTPQDFGRSRERPGMVAAGVLLPPLLLPPLAVGLIRVLSPSPIIAAGLLLVAVCPIGGLSNFYSLLARASVALSVTLTAVSCTAALVTIPAASMLLEQLWPSSLRYMASAPTLVRQLLLGLMPPIALGMIARARWPALAERHRGFILRGAFGLLATLLVLVVATAPGDEQIGWRSATLVTVGFVLAAGVLGGVVASILGGSAADRFTFAAEFSTRNVAVALGLAMAIGAHREFTWFGAIYLTVEIPLLVLAALIFRSRHAQSADAPARPR
jgi:BASS family bile acid:Na+ symporter